MPRRERGRLWHSLSQGAPDFGRGLGQEGMNITFL